MSLGDVTKRAATTEPTTPKAAPKAERTNLAALNQEAAAIVAEFAVAEAALKAATKARDAAKAKALALFNEHAIQDLDGPEGRVQIIVAMGSRRLDLDKVRDLLTEEQVEDCTVVGASQTKVSFKAAKAKGPKEVK